MTKYDRRLGHGRVSVEAATAWIDGATDSLETEQVALNQASGRVLGAEIRAAGAIPSHDCAAIDGFAVRAEASVGAGAYNPLAVPLISISAGQALPAGMDGVVPLDHGEPDGAGRLVLVDPVSPGANVDRQGAVSIAGGLLIAAGTRLKPHHIGLLAVAGFGHAPLIRRPRVRIAIAAAAPSDGAVGADGPMVRAAAERDGGVVAVSRLADACAEPADIVLVIGGAGTVRGDNSAAALAAAGTLDLDGVALVPGETTGFGHTAAGVPVVLLPGAPAARLWSYELFAGRAIRRLGGRDPGIPYSPCTVTTARKIVSTIGTTEICPIRRRPDGRAEPMAPFAEIGLMAAAGADGFMIVPEASEGYPEGAQVTVYLYDER